MKAKTKLNKLSILSIIVAFAMVFTSCYSLLFSVNAFNKNNTASAVYTAEVKQNMITSSSTDLYFPSTSEESGKSSEYSMNRSTSIIGLTTANNIYPIVKYNGSSALSTRSDEEKAADKIDNYVAYLSLNNYEVARKSYTKDDDGNSVYETVNNGTKDETVVYVLTSKITTEGTEESDANHQARIAELKAAVEKINNAGHLGYNKLVVIDQYADDYESDDFSNDYSLVSKESDEIVSLKEIVETYTDLGNVGGQAFSIDNFSYYYKRVYEYKENVLYFRTNSSSLKLNKNSYYAMSVWLYTAGDNFTTSLAVKDTSTNGTFSAVANGITTNATWVQFYLFVATSAASEPYVYFYIYVGDEDGVTGTKSLDDYKSTYSSGKEYYSDPAKRLTGTVVVDNLKLYEINYSDYVNQTINGYTPNEIATNCLSEGKTWNNIKNNSKASTTEEDGQTITTYTYSSYPNADALSASLSYNAKYNPELNNNFDGNFQSYANGSDNDDLVINNGNETALNKLDYDSYKDITGTQIFSYYMPKYTTDSGTTQLSKITKDAYRIKYIDGGLATTIVPEEDEFGEYTRTKVDTAGNKVTDEDSGEEVEITVKNNTFTKNGVKNQILKLENTTSFNLGVTTSDIVTANPLAYYKVSVWAYSKDSDATAYAKLFTTINTKDTLVDGQLILASASVTDFEFNGNNENGWKEISFYIKGNPTESYNLQLSLIAGAKQTVYFDNITVSLVSSSGYSSGSNFVDLSTYGLISSNISNGNFTFSSVTTEDKTTNYPYTPTSWTVVSDGTSENVIKGIISTDTYAYETAKVPARDEKGEFVYLTEAELAGKTEDVDYVVNQTGKYVALTTVKEMFGGENNPVTTLYGTTLPATNVYAVKMPNAGEEKFLIKSASFTLSSGNVYKITFEAWFGSNFDGKLYANLANSSSKYATIDFNIDTTVIDAQTWQTFTIYVRTNSSSSLSNLYLEIGATEAQGTMFLQNVNYTTLSEQTKENTKVTASEQFDNAFNASATIQKQNEVVAGKSNVVRFVDLANENFATHSEDKNDETGFYTSYTYNIETKGESASYTQGDTGIVDLTEGFTYNDGTSTVDITTGLINENTEATTALIIRNQALTDYTLVNQKSSTTLSSDSFYKISVDVKTSDTQENGLTIFANGWDVKFENVNTSSVTENNGWKTYTFYLRTEKSASKTFSLSFALGNSEDSYRGWALVSNIQTEKLDEEAYSTATSEESISGKDNILVKSVYKEETSSEDSNSTSGEANNFSWRLFFILFSSIVLVVALVVALVAVIVRRKNKKNGKGKTQKATKNTTEDGGIQ